MDSEITTQTALLSMMWTTGI